MKSTILFILCFLLLGYHNLKAQFYNQRPEFLKTNSTWAFGFRSGVDFTDKNGVQAIRTSTYLAEGAGSVSSPLTGDLEFYVGTQTCYNRHGDTMPNGRGLLPNNSSTSQGVLIVPLVDSPGKYYVFTLNYISNYDKPSLLTYSVVDMALDNGRGDIEASRKNIPLDTVSKLSEAMIAVPGNNCDIWVIVHTTLYPTVAGDTTGSGFKAFHITRNGIDVNTVYSATAERPAVAPDNYGFRQGCMAISPNRERIAIASYGSRQTNLGVLLGKFNPETGIVSDGIWIDDRSSYGVCFSPDNTKLYTTTPTYGSKTINQYTISNYDSAAIAGSLYEIASPHRYFTLKLYNDTIYAAITNTTVLDRINNPNNQGAACGHDSAAIQLIGDTKCQSGLPNDVVFAFPPDTARSLLLDTLVCTNNGNYRVSLNAAEGYSDYEWNDGVTGSNRNITEAGTYWVIGKDKCHSRLDTFIIRGSNVSAIISVDSFTLSTTEAYARYQWFLNGQPIEAATERSYIVTENGNYTVWVNDGTCSDTSAVYKVTNVPPKTSITSPELAAQITVYPNPMVGDIIYIKSPAPLPLRCKVTSIEGKVIREQKLPSSSLSLRGCPPGVYFLEIMSNEGNIVKAERIVKVAP